MARVLVAMSGGVDSSLAAALLVDEGHDVTGVHLKLADVDLAEQVPGQGCCTLDDAQDARRVAQVLGVDFYVWDLSDVFRREVQAPFATEYAAGRTPNPCITCNDRVKYAALLERARTLGFDVLATGHHVALTENRGRVSLRRPTDRRKDQTYVLYRASQEQLRHSRFPVGAYTKVEVRSMARERGLRTATKPESYDVCFIPAGDTAGYLEGRVSDAPGDIVDLDGRVLGQHRGVWRYTIGQRRGLGLGDHERRFVVDLDARQRRVVVGAREALACHWLELDDLHWISGAPPTDGTGGLTVQIRAHGRPVPACLDGHRVEVDEPLYGVAIGQAAVLYHGDECLGGGVIGTADRAPQLPVA
ncbi:MAG: tRNA 2-thiouridine(34) synthase MnmA [Actinobacteria bacterium]|nr:tRNA 2-thiouridine(34) synthase MnmA [Actinomycetota bacterium]